MSLPTVTRTWTIVPNIRIKAGPYNSVNDGSVLGSGVTGTIQNYLYTTKQVLVLTGTYTLKGSAANGTGVMDGVDRWPTPTAIIAGTADAKAAAGNTVYYPTGTLGDSAWVCLTDKAGGDIMLEWTGAPGNPDIIRLRYSPGGLFVTSSYHVSGAAAPTASDEIVIIEPSKNTDRFFSGYATSNTQQQGQSDRIVNYWIASDGKSFRVCPFGLGGTCGYRWGIEQVYMTTGPGAVVWSGSWGFADRFSNISSQFFGTYGGSTLYNGGMASMTIGGVFRQVSLTHGVEAFNSSPSQFVGIRPDSLGASGFHIQPMSIGGLTAPSQGKFGNLVDHWHYTGGTATYGTAGFMFGNKQLIVVGDPVPIVWPWDGVTTPILE